MKFYKYVSMPSAIKIIKSSSVILNNPQNFNDPFDTQLIMTEEDKRQSINLIYNFYLFKAFKELVNNKNVRLTKKQRLVFNIVKKESDAYDKLASKSKEYQKIPGLNKCLKIFENNCVDFEKTKDDFEMQFDSIMTSSLKEATEKLLITCFSKRNDSILMWSHYGDSHRGVCFEFEDERDIFKEVIYKNERPYLNLKFLTGRYLMSEFKNETFDSTDKDIQTLLLDQFFIKQKDWSYEQEIRCLFSQTGNISDDFYFDDGRYFLKMKISKIYIGLKANGAMLDDLIRRAQNRNIPVVFMKEDSRYFKIVPDTNKTINYINPMAIKPSDIELLSNEIKKSLDSECYLAAMSLALTVPSIFGKLNYPELSEKDAYMKWYEANMGRYETCEENLKEQMPYPSADLILSLKDAIQNNWNTLINARYKDFELNGFKLIVQDKNYYEMYSGSACKGQNLDGSSYNELEINIRDFCNKMLVSIENEIKAHPELSERHNLSLRYIDKELDDLKELNLYNKSGKI